MEPETAKPPLIIKVPTSRIKKKKRVRQEILNTKHHRLSLDQLYDFVDHLDTLEEIEAEIKNVQKSMAHLYTHEGTQMRKENPHLTTHLNQLFKALLVLKQQYPNQLLPQWLANGLNPS